ncbi:hypothetical protein GCM10008949_16750 [Deinococcus humi]|nr:hypothetical protein GCM10008949_16750 [Deinococcus humi]
MSALRPRLSLSKERFMEEWSGGLSVGMFLKKEIEHGPLFVNGPLQPVDRYPRPHADLL